jgi:dTDP-4-dehydrorhamnose reductase|tara:strand:+ start:139 stop:1026 length:888 start_codon:yes stop_codon:yes gene_type:complete
MKILILGCKGQLGRCLNDQLKNLDYKVVYTSREQIDIANFKDTESKILDICPDLVINATAYTAVDEAEKDQEMADLINHLAIANVAKISNQLGCWLIHISTDFVFDGNKKIPYKEDDKTNPQCVYGETKLKGELAVEASGCKHIIIRTAWVFSEHGNNFLKTILRLGAERDELSIVGDQIGCPTYAQDIAVAIISIIPQLNSLEETYGIYHFSGDAACSWFEFAKEIFNQMNKYDQISIPTIEEVTTEEYPTLAKRPRFSVLDNKKLQEKFNIYSSDWKIGIESTLKKIDKGLCI